MRQERVWINIFAWHILTGDNPVPTSGAPADPGPSGERCRRVRDVGSFSDVAPG
jgi:hypothetical protein